MFSWISTGAKAATMGNLRAAWLIGWATVRRKRISLAAFAGAAGFFHWLVAVSFPAVGGLETITSVVSTFPDGLRQLLKLAPNLQAGFGLLDYLAFSWFHPVFLGLGAAFVVSRAADALAGQVERGAAYLILSRPVARWSLVVGKAGEMVFGAAVIALTAWAGMALGATLALDVTLPLARFLLVATMAWALFAALGAGALVLSSLTGSASLASGLGTAWTLIAFVLDVIPVVYNSPLAWLNPWHHYFPQEIVATGRLPVDGLLVLCGWLIGGVTVACLIFGRRDLA
jgi:ABC-type transport system involved in multi-copper enzyme maturation permease subunit